MAALTVGLVALAALLVVGAAALLVVAVARALLLLVALVSADVALALAALLALYWFVDSRRRRYARGFYSCAGLPCGGGANATLSEANATLSEATATTPSGDNATLPAANSTPSGDNATLPADNATETEAAGPMVPPVPVRVKTADSCTSETESEEDEDGDAAKAEGGPSPASPASRPDHQAADEPGTEAPGPRARSSSAAAASSVWTARWPPPAPSAAALPRGHRSMSTSSNYSDGPRSVGRRRYASSAAAPLRGRAPSSASGSSASRRAALSAHKSERQRMEDALRSDGYWIGDFHMPRKVVPRPADGSASPKARR